MSFPPASIHTGTTGDRNAREHTRTRFRIAGVVLLVLGATTAMPATAQDPTIELTGDVRVRPEFRDNADLDDTTPDRLRFFGQRTRIGAHVRVNPKVEAKIVAQDTRVWGTEPSTVETASGNQTLDLHEGYLELRWIWDLPLDLRLGRQALEYGRGRLVGRRDWSNRGRAFDAYRLRFGLGDVFFDLLSAKLVETNSPLPPGPKVSDQDVNFSGAYFSRRGEPLEQLDLYWLRLIDKTSPATGEIKVHTFGALGRRQLPGDLTIEIELAYQGGEAADSVSIDAHMLTAELAWHPEGAPRDLHALLGFDLASGDDDPAGGDIRTFNQLFPSVHPHLGGMDYAGRQNLRDLRARIGGRALGSLRGHIDVHVLSLDDPRDAWYGVEGIPNPARADFGPDPTRKERELGVELDLSGEIDFAPGSTIHFGYGRFFAGDLAGLGGAPRDDSDFAFAAVRVAL